MVNALKDRVVIVIALEHYNPLSQLRALGENGVRPVFIAINHKVRVASPSKWPSKVHLVDTEEEAFDVLMKEYGDVAEKTGKKPILSFSDDKTVAFYDKMYPLPNPQVIPGRKRKKEKTRIKEDKERRRFVRQPHRLPVLRTSVFNVYRDL